MTGVFRLLGPLELRDPGGRLVVPPRRKQRTLLALLLVRTGSVVTSDEMMDALWGARPPASARANLYSYVSGLRSLLARVNPAAGPRPVSAAGGYRLDLLPDESDALLFEGLADQGRRELAEGRPGAATEILARALGLWRGAAFQGLEPADWLQPYAARLDELRLGALEDQADARLRLGRHTDVAGELTALTRRHPLRERMWALLMAALHRAGHTTDALRAYNRLCDLLDAELGAAPGAAVREVHRRIRAGAAAPGPATPVADVVPAMLPPDIADFTGRHGPVEALGDLLRGGPDRPATALTVVGVGGMAGIGKTTLAIHVAHRIAPSFPDGQLYVNLRGAERTPVESADALGRFLHALGVDSRTVPPDLAERTALYRARLAGRRVLVVLDNAAAEEQVRPLLPGSASCAVLVTGRRRLTGIEGVRWLDLAVFERDEAVELLGRMVGGHRLAAEPEATADVVRLCGGLPLAVRIAGARLNARPTWPVAHLVQRLGDERERLDGMATGDLEVRASLALSYAGLAPPARFLLRRLALFDVPHFPAWLAAAVTDTQVPAARADLESLVDAQLLGVTGPDSAGQPRHRFHDLVRLYARERAEVEDGAEERRWALERGFGGWLAIAERKAVDVPGACYAPIGGTAPRTVIVGAEDGIGGDAATWFDAERAALVAAVTQACAQGLDELAFDLAGCMEKYFDLRGMFGDWAGLNARVMAACRGAGNTRGEAVMLRGLIDVTTWCTAMVSPDVVAMTRSSHGAARLLAMFTQLGDERGMSDAAVMCSWGLTAAWRHEAAVAQGEQALRLARRSAHPGGEIRARIALAVAYGDRQGWDQAVDQLVRARDIAAGMRNPRCLATVLQFLGIAHRGQGDLAASERELARSLEMSCGYGDRYAEALTMLALARVHLCRGGLAAARADAEAALGMAREYSMPHHIAEGLGVLGEVELAAGCPARAVTLLAESVALWRTRGWVSFLAGALDMLGRAQAGLDRAAAVAAFTEVRELFTDLGDTARAEAAATRLREMDRRVEATKPPRGFVLGGEAGRVG